jgi:hypothetical protein
MSVKNLLELKGYLITGRWCIDLHDKEMNKIHRFEVSRETWYDLLEQSRGKGIKSHETE